ncbi:hypothetical protein EBY67_06720 [bacterium]|nr:hypothetical protein [Verrucomicrobiota bacterium]NDH86729.1 hypothetical protein [bacterium]
MEKLWQGLSVGQVKRPGSLHGGMARQFMSKRVAGWLRFGPRAEGCGGRNLIDAIGFLGWALELGNDL